MAPVFIAPSLARPLCVSWAGVADEDSGISSMSATLYRADGDDEVAVWPAVELSPAEAGEWCASGADSAALETGCRLLWEIIAKNGANLTKTEESAAAIVDRTEPTAGEATLRVVYPPGFDDRAEPAVPGFGDGCEVPRAHRRLRRRRERHRRVELHGEGHGRQRSRHAERDLLPGELVVDSRRWGRSSTGRGWFSPSPSTTAPGSGGSGGGAAARHPRGDRV